MVAGCGFSRPTPERGAATAGPPGRFDVRRYGARGDGRTNDTSAFRQASEALTAAGGGDLVIPAGTYVVGRQRTTGEAGTQRFASETIVRIEGCRRPVRILGGGAVLQAAPGLRFGSFDPVTGGPSSPPALPFTDYSHRADAYLGMLVLVGNEDVEVSRIELDGNSAGLVLGGPWGDSGRQCSATGIYAYGNRRLRLDDVHTHHHGLDGITIGFVGLTASSPAAPHRLTRVRSEYNARQGLSIVGAIDLTADRCTFSHTGRGGFASTPAAGVDVEAEDSVVRRVELSRCEMIDNEGYAFIADTGDSADIRVRDSLIWGTPDAGALWPRKPGMAFEGCRIYGWVVNAFGSSDPAQATRFTRCVFEDRPHPQFGPPKTGLALLEFDGQNVILDGCTVTANRTRSVLFGDPSTREIVRGCTLEHRHAGLSNGDYQAQINGAAIEGTTFRTRFAGAQPSAPYYVSHQNVAVGPGVLLEGAGMTWGPNGATGAIAPTG